MSVYLALFSILAIGAGAVAIDFGRSAALRVQMQNHADALALAGAVYLDGTNGARDRAEAVILGTAQATTNIAEGGGELTVSSVEFFSSLNPDVAATSDEDTVFVRVTLNPQTINYFFAPVLNVISDAEASDSGTMAASATGAANPIYCNAPPLMMCDMSEVSASDDQTLPQNAGKQVLLKSPQGTGNQSWAP
ncbi:MAG: Tad domain-containing protein, partial [Alphaproteobacteria bacterium]|nr:Tad domain-containing protein [Alphaproteobacteria bacterium]